MRVFITGVAGFLGSHVADALLALGHSVAGVDNMIGGERANVPRAVDFNDIDCLDFEAVKQASHGCEIVYHCAAAPHEGLSVFSPYFITANGIAASISVFSAAIANRAKRIVFCSSMARYGADDKPFREDFTAPLPQDPYGIGKLASEQILANLCATHGVEYAIAVPHNIIGPRQKFDDPFRNVASIMINLMLQGRQPVIYGDGSQVRCFSYVSDCVDCLVEMAFSDRAQGEVINIGPDEHPITVLELAERIARLIGFNLHPEFMPGRPQEVKHATCSSEKARRLLGYQTRVSLDDGLSEMIAAIRQRGPRPFNYHIGLEIVTDKTPRTWTERVF